MVALAKWFLNASLVSRPFLNGVFRRFSSCPEQIQGSLKSWRLVWTCRSQAGAWADGGRPDVSDVSTASPYLKADSSKAQTLRKKYGIEVGDRPLVGVSWCSYRVGLGPHKSTNLVTDWGPIFAALPNAVFVPPAVRKTIGYRTRHCRRNEGVSERHFFQDENVDATGNIDALAAQVVGLDAVVSVSNTTVHLAGALGVPTWTLVPTGPSRLWYWLDGRKSSPWYSSVTLAWQKETGSWIEPVNEVAENLKEWVSK